MAFRASRELIEEIERRRDKALAGLRRCKFSELPTSTAIHTGVLGALTKLLADLIPEDAPATGESAKEDA